MEEYILLTRVGVSEFKRSIHAIPPLEISRIKTGSRACYLGVGAFTHDTSVSIVDCNSGMILFALSEERLSNKKHDSGFPIGCIKKAMATLPSLDAHIEKVCVNFDPQLFLFEGVFSSLQWLTQEEIHKIMSKAFLDSLYEDLDEAITTSNIGDLVLRNILSKNLHSRIPGKSHLLQTLPIDSMRRIHWYLMLFHKYTSIMRIIEKLFPTIEVINVRHHLSHAASALYSSGYSSGAAVLVLDGHGEVESCSMLEYSKRGIHQLTESTFWPHSLGAFYLMLTRYLGFDYGDEYKVMGMSAYGNPKHLEIFRSLIQFDATTGRLKFEPSDYLELSFVGDSGQVRYKLSDSFHKYVKPRQSSSDLLQEHFDLASSLQTRVEELGVGFAKFIRENSSVDSLVIAGGVALNGLMNNSICKLQLFKEVFVFPAAGDDGTSAGAAMNEIGIFSEKIKTVFFGPFREKGDIENLLDKAGVVYDYNRQISRTIADLLTQKKIVARYLDRSEFGPRALGNRSILASANHSDMKDILNLRIKHRESFRPFAPAIMEEHAKEFFEMDADSPFMLQIVQAKEITRKKCPSIVHEDGTSRVQTVSKDYNPKFYSLLNEYRELTNIPILINTSFNVNGEAIVESPLDALESFCFMDIDYLAIGDFLISKENNQKLSLSKLNHHAYLNRRLERYVNEIRHPLIGLDCRAYESHFYPFKI